MAKSQVEMISWRRPPPSYIKLNTDGSSKPGQAGAAGLFRDQHGNWLFGFASNLGPCSSAVAEWTALKMGLTLAWERGYRRLLCEVDAAYILTSFGKVAKTPKPEDSEDRKRILGIISECRELLSREWDCTIIHTKREGNASADAMAKVAVTLPRPGICLFRTPPPMLLLREALIRDVIGIAVPRGFRGRVICVPPPPPPPRRYIVPRAFFGPPQPCIAGFLPMPCY